VLATILSTMNFFDTAFKKFALILLSLLAAPNVTAADSVAFTDHVRVELIAEYDEVASDLGDALFGIKLTVDEGWHIYWQNPGDTGLPTEISWSLPDQFVISSRVWPIPTRFTVGELVNYGYKDSVIFPQTVSWPGSIPSAAYTIAADVSWLVCKELCIPGSASVARTVLIGTSNRFSQSVEELENSLKTLPNNASAELYRAVVSDSGDWAIDLGDDLNGDIVHAEYFPYTAGQIDIQAVQVVDRYSGGRRVRGRLVEGSNVDERGVNGVLVVETTNSVSRAGIVINAQPEKVAFLENAPQMAQMDSNIGSLWIALIFALVGGVILNFMPCVLPIIAIKALTLVERVDNTVEKRVKDALLFGVGVVLTFLFIGSVFLVLRSLGEQVGWGFQLQSPQIIFVLSVLFLALALNLNGLFEMGTRIQTVGNLSANSKFNSSFMSGVLATIIATPCTAPLMGAALGYSLTQSHAASMLIFFMLGIGMALPYMLLATSPRIAKILPKPGRWMSTLKSILSLPLFLTVVWLMWVLGLQTDMDTLALALVALVVVGFICWVYGRYQSSQNTYRRRWRAVLLGLIVMSGVVSYQFSAIHGGRHDTGENALAWLPWTAEGVQAARDRGDPVFIDFTAAWCVTCQINKRVVLRDSAIKRLFKENGVALFVADWTNKDQRIATALASLGRSGIPTYVFYPSRGADPTVLSEFLTVEEIQGLIE